MVRPLEAHVHRTIVVVDVEGFGDRRRTIPHQLKVRSGLYRIVRQALEESGVPWDSLESHDRGDGIFTLVPPAIPKSIFVDSVPTALVAALREHNETHSDEAQIRLRMALHAGEVAYDDHGATGSSINLAFRMVDARPLKTALAGCSGVLALMASEWFYEDVVRHSARTDLKTFQQVDFATKETSTTGWINCPGSTHVPRLNQGVAR